MLMWGDTANGIDERGGTWDEEDLWHDDPEPAEVDVTNPAAD
jgi:hypothetical protein